MAKCIKCGKGGLFHKVDKNGWCNNCRLEHEHQDRMSELLLKISKAEGKLADTQQLLDDAINEAKTKAQRLLEAEEVRLKQALVALQGEIDTATSKHEKLVKDNASAEKSLASVQKKTEKLKPMANSITKAFEAFVAGEDREALTRIASMSLEELLPTPQLNCLTIKTLNARYKSIRKQITDLCAAYESRYTTKTNAALYKLMVLALEAELENILTKLRFGKLETGVASVKELTLKYYAIATDGNQSIAPTIKRFIGQIESLYIECVETEYEYYVQRERAREEQRALKEQMKQEAEERKRLEAEKKRVEAEEKKYQQEMVRLSEELKSASDAEAAKLQQRLDELSELVKDVEEKKAEIVNLQNGKAGTVYVISNIGSFGEQVFKIGMTRRLEPQDRIDELSNASVPFPFDVHSFIFSQDAVGLESALHKELNERRVNKVNLRKEFFNISIEELQQLVERIDPTAPFQVTALAEQYRQSLSITDVPDEDQVFIDDDAEE